MRACEHNLVSMRIVSWERPIGTSKSCFDAVVGQPVRIARERLSGEPLPTRTNCFNREQSVRDADDPSWIISRGESLRYSSTGNRSVSVIRSK